MIVIEIDAQLWTILSGIGGLAGVFALLITIVTIAKSRQKKREELEHSCDELCAAISNSKIHTLLNNIIAICDKGTDEAKNIIEVQNELKQIFHEASTKWDAVQSKLNTKKQRELLGKLETVFHDYQSCAKDAETIVIALGLGNVEEVKRFLSNNNSQEIRDIVHTTSELYEDDLQGFIKQIISLRFKDLDIPNYASQIRVLMKENHQDNNVLETQLLARIGNARAQNALGDYYYQQDQCEKAFSWYLKSAKQGLSIPQHNIGVFYTKGIFVEVDETKAFVWFKKSAEQGFANAQYMVGRCYEYGKGIDKDEREAFAWYKKSAEQGYVNAQYMVGWCYEYGKGIDKDEREAFAWCKKSAEQGDADAQYMVGWCYEYGKGIDKDESEAFAWYKKSAEQGDASAEYVLGLCYEYGKGIDKDESEAFGWYKKSAEQGDASAEYALGLCYYYGCGHEQDYKKAFECFNNVNRVKIDIEIYSKAIYMIGIMYMNSEIGFGSDFVAVDYFKIAAQNGHVSAQYQLGDCYEHGIGVKEVNLEEAKFWYEEAAKQGDVNAIESLKRLEKSE